MKLDDEEFARRVRSTLDSSVANIDAETRTRLSAMRCAALEQRPFLSRWNAFNRWGPMAALAASVIFAFVIFINPSSNRGPEQLAVQDNEIILELLNGEADIDLDDPEFYVWLDAVMLGEEDFANAS